MAKRGKEPKVRMVCETCGSEHVTRDAWAQWDAGAQQWVLGAVYDYAFCHACRKRTHIEDVPR
jgi:alpha-D-ribose 1-methylphosphonate 5-phosphate C-P lyase